MDTPTDSAHSSPGRGGSSRIDAALTAQVEAARREASTSSSGSVEDIGDAAQSIAPAASPWADTLGRVGSRAGQVVLIAAVAVGLLWVLFQVKVVLIAVMVALILASAVAPLVKWLERKGWSNLLATLAAFVGILALLGIVVTSIVFSVMSQWDILVSQAEEGWNKLQQFVDSGPLPIDTGTIDNAARQAGELISSGNLASGALTGISAATQFVTGLVLMVVVLFFFLKDGQKMWNFALRWTHGERRAKLAESVDRGSGVLGGYVRGTALVALVDAVFIGAFLLIFGVPLAIPLTAVVFITAFIPVVGATVAGILAALVALVTNGPVIALALVAWIIVVNQVEGNILQPVIMGRTLSLHALVILLALTVGTLVGGIFGAILAVPYTAVAWAVIQVWASGYQEGHDPVLGDDPLNPKDRVEAKATMAQRWKYQRMRLEQLRPRKTEDAGDGAGRAEDHEPEEKASS